jgi:hypothetical protein
MADIIHPFYEAHRAAMESAMRQRLDLADAMLSERAQLSDRDGIRQEVMAEFGIVLAQMPYVGGAASRMSDFFMRLCGFCKFAQQHEDQEILPNICGIDFVAYAARGIHLERTQTLAGGASHCNFRFSRR